MTNSEGMGKPGIDNDWVFRELKRIGKEHKDLAEALGVHPSQVTRLKKNDRKLTYDEGNALKLWFSSFNHVLPQNGHDSKKDLSPPAYTKGQVAHREGDKEGPPMSDGELLRFMRALIEDNEHLRKRVQQLEDVPATSKGKRRRRP